MSSKVKIIQTSGIENVAWRELDEIKLKSDFNLRMDTVAVDSKKTFQTHMGFGGAFTEAAAYVYANTTEENQADIINSYFNKEKGLGYNLGRTTIGGCDFALKPYTYIEEGDETLETFDMSRDEKWIIPMFMQAEKCAKEKLRILCSPWSPPAFMKDNQDIDHGGHLLEKYYHAWATYMVKYIGTMLTHGINIEMVTIQNEPEAKQIWASCIYDSEKEAIFAVDYLYEELKKAGLEKKIKILIWDHNRDRIYSRVKEFLQYKNAKDVIWGVAYHWYVSENSENLTMVHELCPDKHLVFTEGCVEIANLTGATSSKERLGAWKHGETYGRNIIKDFNNYCEAWIDWNLVLDEIGGPNYVENYCEAPIIINTKTDELIKNWSYYYIGHFSKYIKPGAKRLLCRSDAEKDIFCTAYKNPNGEIVVVVQSEHESHKEIALDIDGMGANIGLPAHSITTFILER